MYGKLFILAIIGLVVFSFSHNASALIQIDPASVYYNDSGNYVPYKLIQNSNSINVLTKQGSFIFDKNSCSFSFYNNTNTNGSPLTGGTYSVLASQGNTGIWNPVSVINNAACTTAVSENNGKITVTATKSVAGAGVFTVNYTKPALHPLKISYSATNNNPAWTNSHIGLRDTLPVPRFISLGNQTFDLSQFNNTVLSRAWISTHSAQLLKLGTNTKYDMGLAWNNAEQITIHWIGGKASIDIDYIHNTPILSPGQTITVDPSLDTSNTNVTDGATTITITVGSNSNRLLIWEAGYAPSSGSATALSVTSVTDTTDGKAFTKLITKVNNNGGNGMREDIWYLTSNQGLGTGAKTITVVWGTAPFYSTMGLTSLYNVDQTTPINNATTTSFTGVPVNPSTLSITPTQTGSWILQYLGMNTGPAPSAPNHTQLWNTLSSGLYTAAQYYSAPTIGGSNALSWTTGTGGAQVLFDIEVKQKPSAPLSTTLTKVNTLNSTSINATWASSVNATFYLLNATLSGGSTTHINTTKTFVVLNNYTQGSKYTFAVFAANKTGTSSSSPTRYNYTFNVAATAPTMSSITGSSARLSWTNPAGNVTGGFAIYRVTALGSNYTLVANTSNSTNHYDFSSLQGNREYSAKLATRYAVGVNYSGLSANSTVVSFYTLPAAPTGLTTSQTVAHVAHLSWTVSDNGTLLGTKIERSLNGGTSWSTLVANTGNSSTTYNDNTGTSGTFTYRVSSIKYAGTSSPSNTATRIVWDIFTVNEYHADGITPVYGQAIQSNSTSSNNRFTLVSGSVPIPGISGLNNFTAWNSLINFIVGKQYNYNTTANHSLNMSTNDYDVDCSSTGTGVDVEVFTNGTNGHKITIFSTPTCFANNTMKWTTKFTANGNDINSYNTTVYVRAVNATFGAVAPLKYNTTKVTTVFTNPYIISNPVIVGTGLQTRTFNWSMNLTVSPAFTPVNFTVGHISVSGVNPVTAPIKFTTTTINSSATAVTVTFPSTYTMGYQLTFGNEGTSHTYTGLPVTSPSLGLGQSTITFLNPKNDLVTIKAYDIPTNTTARYILAQPNNQIPFVTQILNFKNGLFGTSAMIGGIDIVSLIILLIGMIGLNRANETVGAILMVMIIGASAYFGLIQWQTTMTAAIALVVLVIVSTTKKLPWS